MKFTAYSKVALMMLAGAAMLPRPVSAQEQTRQDGVSAPPALSMAITDLQSRWDQVNYRISDKDEQAKALKSLEEKADRIVASFPHSADVKIWDGIIYSTDAGVVGGISALSKINKARELFEDALKIDESAMNGGAHTSLGSLYYKVPGWPISFGDNDMAEKHLKAALAISPDDIDANYFYGDFLMSTKKYEEAVPVLEKAMQAPERPGREIADTGRRKEIQADLDTAQEKLKTALGKKYN